MLQSIRALFFASSLLVCLVAMQPTQSSVLTLITGNPSEVAQFQTGATVEKLDHLAASTITSYDDGQIVPPANRFSSRIRYLYIRSSTVVAPASMIRSETR